MGGRLAHRVGQRGYVGEHDLAEQVRLVGEVSEHRAGRHAGGRGDVADRGAFVSLLAEQATRGGDAFAGALLGERAAGRAPSSRDHLAAWI